MSEQDEKTALDIWFFDTMAVDLSHTGRVLDVAASILCQASHVRPDGSRNLELDQVGSVLAAAQAHVEKLTAEFEKQFLAWRAVVRLAENDEPARAL